MIPHLLLLLGGFGALYFGAEWLVRGAARISSHLGISPVVVGLTVVALGTSAPELVVCVVASLEGGSDLAIGNVMGSNLANVGLILGITALVRPLHVATRVVVREIPIMLLLTVLMYPLVFDLEISRGEGVLLISLLCGYIAFVFGSSTEDAAEIIEEVEELTEESHTDTEAEPHVTIRDVGLVAMGGLGLLVGGEAIVRGARFVAGAMGASELVIGLTVVAIGTSLPELVTSVVAGLRKQIDIAVGNIIGSNIFNLTVVLGGAAVAHPVAVAPGVLRRELFAVVVLSFLVLPVARSSYFIRRSEGALLLVAYFALTTWLMLSR